LTSREAGRIVFTMDELCRACGQPVAAGTRAFAGRSRLEDGSLLCPECVAAVHEHRRTRNLSDLEAAVEISNKRRVDMGVGAALAHGTRMGR
jgi:hypothetical protein